MRCKQKAHLGTSIGISIYPSMRCWLIMVRAASARPCSADALGSQPGLNPGQQPASIFRLIAGPGETGCAWGGIGSGFLVALEGRTILLDGDKGLECCPVDRPQRGAQCTFSPFRQECHGQPFSSISTAGGQSTVAHQHHHLRASHARETETAISALQVVQATHARAMDEALLPIVLLVETQIGRAHV